MRGANDRADATDVHALYRFFLGREPERAATARDAGAALTDEIRIFARSDEFRKGVWPLLAAGRDPTAPLLATPPPADLASWAARRLPLSAIGRATAARSGSWYALHDAVFGDPVFRERILDDTFAFVSLADRVHAGDVRALYRLFLGREPETDPATAALPTASLLAEVRQFVTSEEFAHAIQPAILTASAASGRAYDAATGAAVATVRDWAATRLPLSARTRRRLRGLTSWRMLLTAVLSDRIFLDVMARGYLPADDQAPLAIPVSLQALIVEASLLFERDWYLATYRNVAAAGADPLLHHLLHGTAEGTNPNRLFDTRWYLSAYPEARLRKVVPLVHYLVEGAKLGYRPHPFFPPTRPGEEGQTPLAHFLHDVVPRDPAALPRFTPFEVHEAASLNYRRMAAPATRDHIATMPLRPTFVVLIDDRDHPDAAATAASVARQSYPDHRLVASADAAARLARRAAPGGMFLLWLAPGDELREDAFYEVAAWLNRTPGDELVYFDHAQAPPGGTMLPFYKPDWSPDYLEGCNYLGTAACFELRRAAGFLKEVDNVYDLALRFGEVTRRIGHVRETLLTSRADPMRLPPARQAGEIEALRKRLVRTGRVGTVAPALPEAGCYDVSVALRREPLVSAVIPTAARVITYEGETIDLIVNCLESITASSDYDNVEFIVVDNGDLDRGRLHNVPQDRLRFVTYDAPEVNIAAKINLGASLASGELILILNDDIVPLRPDWIRRMVAQFEKHHVGMVGAKLLYPSRLIQHVGMGLCDGIPDHIDRFRGEDDPGYFFSGIVPRNYSSVTGAVQMVRQTLFREIGGYDEQLPIDFNDVDFAYRVRERGYSLVLEPRAKLIHYESVSAVKPPRPWDADYFSRRWAAMAVDPFFDEYRFAKHPATFDVVYSERRH